MMKDYYKEGKLEDLLEKYNINSLKELESALKKVEAFDYIIKWNLDIDCILWCYACNKSYNDYVSNRTTNSGYINEKIFNFILDIIKGMIEDE